MVVEKDAAYYRALPYTRRVEPREEAGRRYWLAWVQELPSIEIHGDSREEALARLGEIFDDCIIAMIEAGEEIVEPRAWPRGLFGSAARRNGRRIRKELRQAQTGQEAQTGEAEVQVDDEAPLIGGLVPTG